MTDELAHALCGRLQGLRKQQCQSIARMLWPVCAGLRTACLVDCAVLSDLQSATILAVAHVSSARVELHDVRFGTPLIAGIQEHGHTGARDRLRAVVFVDEAQTFFVNLDLLKSWMSLVPRFVDVSVRPPKVTSMPDGIPKFVERILSADELVLRMPSCEQPAHLVALAGLLLDYPVVYCFDENPRSTVNSLGGVDLTVVSTSLVTKTAAAQRIPLSSFSFPTDLLMSEDVIPDYERTLECRRAGSGQLRGHRIEVIVTHTCMDQVAL